MQHAVCVPPVGPDVPTGQDSGRVLRGPPAGGHGPGGPGRPRAQYPQNYLLLALSVIKECTTIQWELEDIVNRV